MSFLRESHIRIWASNGEDGSNRDTEMLNFTAISGVDHDNLLDSHSTPQPRAQKTLFSASITFKSPSQNALFSGFDASCNGGK
jgi:hypothetical protein